MTNKEIEDLIDAYHEAAHVGMAWWTGAEIHEVRIGTIKIEKIGDAAGHAIIDNFPSLESRIVTLLAGPLAELRFNASHLKPIDMQFDSEMKFNWDKPSRERFSRGLIRVPFDSQTADEFELVCGILSEALVAGDPLIRSTFEFFYRKTCEFLNHSQIWNMIEEIASNLAKTKHLDAEQVKAICQKFHQR